MNKLQGVICPMVTPLDENQNIDEAGTRKLVRRLREKGASGLFILGTMGEFPMIVEEEKRRLVEIVVDEAGRDISVLVNVSEQGPRKTERTLRMAIDAGAEAIVLTPPHYYNTRNKRELFNYYTSFSRNTDVPVIIYDAGYTNNSIPTDILLELSAERNIIGVKCAVFTHAPLLREFYGRDDFAILHGDETSLDLAVHAGADGIVPGISSLAVDLCVELFQSAKSGQLAEAMRVQKQLLHIQRTVYGVGGTHWGNGQKYALSQLGVCQEHIATTLLPLSEEDRRDIGSMLTTYGIS
ncbi:dihydrodipicolinate synthase family protein [Paenibacillus thalictri]|uniref:Dihydrodipicolinate synthase family protein n=1 Tax=Paenibacillus thalictri TaxID=2527873 RepID=A0A4Q9DSY8_9BACL|nr:dihydrodipicolinate synthase family protein [Paenibacillus thalictri]TBL79356.1 dihydrodipicolinate synthase family protein [Paenibacillus thalictri]